MSPNIEPQRQLRSIRELERATLEAMLMRDAVGLGQISLESSFRIHSLDPSSPDFSETLRGLDAVFDASREARHDIVIAEIRDEQNRLSASAQHESGEF